jgi:hypothetical protein
MTYIASLFSFDLQPDEDIGSRIVRCCQSALADGPMGEKQRHDFYRDFIGCNQEESIQKAEGLTRIRTSCAMFVRAVREWCGAPPSGPYKSGTGMFVSMGNLSLSHAAFVATDGSATPNPGDYFYISSTKSSLDGHTGIFIEETSPGVWRTAEGGGGDGTECRFNQRAFAGRGFSGERRTLWGWFDCTKVGLPESPASPPEALSDTATSETDVPSDATASEGGSDGTEMTPTDAEPEPAAGTAGSDEGSTDTEAASSDEGLGESTTDDAVGVGVASSGSDVNEDG